MKPQAHFFTSSIACSTGIILVSKYSIKFNCVYAAILYAYWVEGGGLGLVKERQGGAGAGKGFEKKYIFPSPPSSIFQPIFLQPTGSFFFQNDGHNKRMKDYSGLNHKTYAYTAG